MNDSPYISMKHCLRCKQDLPVSSFAKSSREKDGLQDWCKLCRKQYYQAYKKEISEKHKVYRDTHKEERRAKGREYHQSHREQRLEYARQYRKSHPDLIYEQEKRKREKFKEEIRERQKRWQQTEVYKSYQKRYQKENVDELRNWRQNYYAARAEEWRARQRQYGKTARGRMVDRAHEHKRRAQKKAIDGTLTTQQIQAKLKAQKYTCYYCFAKFEKRNDKYIFHLEHTIPLARTEHSPRHDINYVVLSCPTCNQKKGTRLPHEFWEGGRLF